MIQWFSILLILVFGALYQADDSTHLATSPLDKSTHDKIMNLSIDFLTNQQRGVANERIVKDYAALDLQELQQALDSDTKKLAFWINTYNGFVQYILTNDSSLFNDRGAFFSNKQMTIAGQRMSLDDIEHGIIRSNRWKLSLGYLSKPFPPKFVRKLKTKKRDPRVHMALNCGAASCPPIAIYDPNLLDDQLDFMTRNYLQNNSIVSDKSVTITPLMSWFRRDFGNKKDRRKFLEKYDVIKASDDVSIKYGSYDWTLSLGNYTEAKAAE